MFVPVAVETMDALGEEASDCIHDLCKRIEGVTRERWATEFLLQRFSVAIHRGNAVAVQGTVGNAIDNLDAILYL